MKLLLTSNGLQGKIKEVFPTLLTKNPSECSAAFITTAAFDGADGDPEIWLDKYRQQLRDQGITNIEDIDLREYSQEKLEKVIESKDIIYVNGGNTFLLLDGVRKSGFKSVVKKFLDEGKLYIGVSAGSIICTPSIENASWEPEPDENIVGMTYFTGMSLVDFLIAPHVEDIYLEMIQKSAEKVSYPTTLLTDEQAVLVQDGKTEVIGDAH